MNGIHEIFGSEFAEIFGDGDADAEVVPAVGGSPVYGAGTIKRTRRTKEQMVTLDRQIIAEVNAHHPQSVRHIFYRMTDPRLPEPVEKSERGYRHVQDRVVKLRRRKRIPYGWISDATRQGHFVHTFSGPGDFITRVADNYRADLWSDADTYCEVWCESRSIAGVILPVCRDLAVNLYPAAGFSSLTLVYEAAEYIMGDYNGRPITVFYIGDYDPAGVLIDKSIERELRGHLPPSIDMDFRRIGITAEQIEEYDLPRKPRKTSDRREKQIENTVEAEAMPAQILCDLLRDCVEGLLPEGALVAAQVAEIAARKDLKLIGANTDD